ncbi:F-box only protein 43 [Phyllopteryx taeniolatus]|uniref:F-box only protein 43 n=1 Tax=Phyllopteryx taeniolatus TaxID=161469 RepID=UPI002AD3A90F|nr:F-box only protein 43 [Phyllopteryx taeniolatus]XP_061633831.1 F-box only protein 43 [Phyllopteryx taeniolatus]
MQCTPESNVYHGSCKGQQCDECFDSGYSGLFHSPQSISGFGSSRPLASVDFIDTPKEYLRLPVTPKESSRAPLHKDSKGLQRSCTLNWCETPKVCKRYVSLRHRPALCDATKENATSPCTGRIDSSIGSDHWPNVSFDSLDTTPQSLTLSTLKLEQDFPLSGRKRRLLFSQVRTSTRVDGTFGLGDSNSLERRISLLDDFSQHLGASDQLNVEAPCLSKFLLASSKENSPSPVNKQTSDLYDSSSVLCTPSSSQTPKYIRSVCEDSGFSSLALDKSQGSSVDHDGSFQELLLSASKGNSETPNLTDTKRRSRLQRQQRLSTLKEGGSLSDEDLSDRKHQHIHSHGSTSKDEVFLRETPRRVLTTSDVPASNNEGYTTPRSQTTAKLDGIPPSSTTSVNSNVTPFKTTVSNLSLTPALQLIHTLCEQRANMFAGQSPSLKEQLRTTSALTETPVMLSTIMPLAGLIGRKMGLGKVDLLTELRKRNLRHILAVILSHLSAECVYRCCQVCKDWNEIIQQDKQAHLKKEIHRSEVEAALELGGTVHVSDAETRLALLERSALKTVQAQSRTSSYCTPRSGRCTVTPLQNSTLSLGSSSKREKFVEIAKTLFNDECLRHCPRCQHPAKCHFVKREGICTRADCAFQFCTACLCAFHGARECGSQSAGRRKKDALLPGSAQSKRNIRRL